MTEPSVSLMTTAELAALGRDATRLHLCGLLMRPGVMTVLTRLEYEHFPPRTAANEAFIMHLLPWAGLPMALVSVPLAARPTVEALAARCGLLLRPGAPLLQDLGTGEPTRSPIQGPTVVWLEHVPDHPVYTADPDAQIRLVRQEQAEVRAYIAAWERAQGGTRP